MRREKRHCEARKHQAGPKQSGSRDENIGIASVASRPRNDMVVITGMGLVSPLGNDLGEVWSRVRRGASGIGPWNGIPAALAMPYSQGADRAFRFAREASLAALKDAGLFPLDSSVCDPTRFGMTLGSSKGGIPALERSLREGFAENTMEDFFHHSANARIMRETGISGPCIALVSACATGANSIVQGARWILDGDADCVLAGASESSLTPLVVAGFQSMGVLAKAGPGENPQTLLRPFDRMRRGFVIGEGAGVLVLESTTHARKRRARVHAELSGWGLSGDGYKPASFNPNGDAIERAASICASRAGVAVRDMDYINCHGTGTRENDSIESVALKRLLGRGRQHTALSSTKPMTGHLLGAAGAVEMILTVQALQNNFVPATLNLHDPAPECDLDFTALEGREKEIRNAMSLSYGFGGHVAAIAVRKITPHPALPPLQQWRGG